MAHKTSEGQRIRRYQVDGDFVEIMGLRMVQGRALTDEPSRRRSGRHQRDHREDAGIGRAAGQDDQRR